MGTKVTNLGILAVHEAGMIKSSMKVLKFSSPLLDLARKLQEHQSTCISLVYQKAQLPCSIPFIEAIINTFTDLNRRQGFFSILMRGLTVDCHEAYHPVYSLVPRTVDVELASRYPALVVHFLSSVYLKMQSWF